MTGQSILQLAVSLGLGGIIVAVINAIMNKRKLSAEATEIITKAAAGTVENIMKDNQGLREKVATLETEMATCKIAIASAERRERQYQMDEERWRWHTERWHNYAMHLKENPGSTLPMPPLWPNPREVVADPNIEEL